MIQELHEILTVADIGLNINLSGGKVRVIVNPILKKEYKGESKDSIIGVLSKGLVLTGDIKEVDENLQEVLSEFSTKYATNERMISSSIDEIEELTKSIQKNKDEKKVKARTTSPAESKEVKALAVTNKEPDLFASTTTTRKTDLQTDAAKESEDQTDEESDTEIETCEMETIS